MSIAVEQVGNILRIHSTVWTTWIISLLQSLFLGIKEFALTGTEVWQSWPLSQQIGFLVICRWYRLSKTLSSVMLSLSLLTYEVWISWSESFVVLAGNGNTVWLCMVNSVSFISFGPYQLGPTVKMVNTSNIMWAYNDPECFIQYTLYIIYAVMASICPQDRYIVLRNRYSKWLYVIVASTFTVSVGACQCLQEIVSVTVYVAKLYAVSIEWNECSQIHFQ